MRILGIDIPLLIYFTPMLLVLVLAVFAIVMVLRWVKAAERTAAATESVAAELKRRNDLQEEPGE